MGGMVYRKSIMGRIAVGKVVGLVVGAICLFFLPWFGFEPLSMFGLGTLIMFVLMGATIGMMGIFTRCPVSGFPLSWWLRGPLVGLAFMLMYILLSYDDIITVLQSSMLIWTGMQSPFWALLDGAFIGAVMGYLCTKISGEGPDLPAQ